MKEANKLRPQRKGLKHRIAEDGAVPNGRGATVQLKDGTEVALFNAGGKLFAVENYCPHQGFPLADSRLYGETVECDLHGWQFDLNTGACLTKKKCSIESYEVVVEDGWIYIIA